MAEYDGAGALQATYIHGPGIDEPLQMRRDGVTYFYQRDGLDSIVGLANAAGTVVRSYRYDSFGRILSETGSLENPYVYTGRERDAETGLYYYRARYYDPHLGRFINEDPIGFESGDENFYNYVFSNPTNFVDPFGHGIISAIEMDAPAVTGGIPLPGPAPPTGNLINTPATGLPGGIEVASSLTYDSGSGMLTLYDGSGNAVGQYPASNNTTSSSQGSWPAGTYSFSYHVPHAGQGPDDRFGSNGNFVFDVSGRSGMGVHSGRQNSCDRAERCGSDFATEGCIRTTDTATSGIRQLHYGGDPLTNITVNLR